MKFSHTSSIMGALILTSISLLAGSANAFAQADDASKSAGETTQKPKAQPPTAQQSQSAPTPPAEKKKGIAPSAAIKQLELSEAEAQPLLKLAARWDEDFAKVQPTLQALEDKLAAAIKAGDQNTANRTRYALGSSQTRSLIPSTKSVDEGVNVSLTTEQYVKYWSLVHPNSKPPFVTLMSPAQINDLIAALEKLNTALQAGGDDKQARTNISLCVTQIIKPYRQSQRKELFLIPEKIVTISTTPLSSSNISQLKTNLAAGLPALKPDLPAPERRRIANNLFEEMRLKIPLWIVINIVDSEPEP